MTSRRRPRPPASQGAGARLASIDNLRGIAIVAMVAYHFAFDLAYFRLIDANFYRDAFWLNARTVILSSFLLLAGVSLVLAERRGQSHTHFWRHVLRIAACAVLVSAASYFVFPRSFIWFGVLHAIAVSLVLVRPLAARPLAALVLGLAVIAAGIGLAWPAFDREALGWIGFATVKPVTEDYVPLFPWTGVILVGIALGHALARNDFRAVAMFAMFPRVLALLGRHSLLVYMLHQPILLGALWLFMRARL
jgi:uncharacterized membrane protein